MTEENYNYRTNPHDHNIDYDPSHRPIYVKPQINYPADQYPDGEKSYYETSDEVLERYIGNDRLRDIITQATVLDRAL